MESSNRDLSAKLNLTELGLEKGDVLNFGSVQFCMESYIGEGTFGKVAIWKDVHIHKSIAVKIPKQDWVEEAFQEMEILEALQVLDADAVNVVKYYGCYPLSGYPCLAFEMLDTSLSHLISKRGPLKACEIRPIAKQLLDAFDALRGIGIVHADMKPDNIMVADAKEEPLRVKLIDFGLAIYASDIQPGVLRQAVGYRAPEVSLGLACSEAVDLWGLGCILACLYLRSHLFPWDCGYQEMKCIVELCGQPEDEQLSTGCFTNDFFIENEEDDGPRFRLMTADEYSAHHGVPVMERRPNRPSSLDDLLDIHPSSGDVEVRKAMIDLLKELLNVDGSDRITPHQALQHPFFTICDRSNSSDHSDLTRTSSVLSLDSAIGLGDLFETSCSPPASRVADLDSALGLRELFQTPCSPLAAAATGLHPAVGPAAPSSSDSADSCDLQDEAESLSRAEVSVLEGEPPSPGPAGRVRRALKRVRGFFKGVRKIFCCCVRPPVID